MNSASRWFRVIYVRPVLSRRTVHFEVFEETGLQASDALDRVRTRSRELAVTYPLDRYDIYDISYSSVGAMRGHHPELEFPDME